MKKMLVISAAAMLSACACFEPEYVDEKETQEAQPQQVVVAEPVENVRVIRRRVRVYNDGYQEPRRVRRIYYNDAAPHNEDVAEYRRSAPVYEPQEPVQEQYCDDYNDSPCPAKVRVMREPVEVIYRKTKYTTVYQPRTFKDVSYEREPYAGNVQYQAPAYDNCEDCMN